MSTTIAPGAGKAPMPLLILLTIGIGIDYIDRGNLATAAPLIQDDLHLTPTQLGLLGSAFFWAYVPMHIPAGWLSERFGARRVLAAGVALWSLATAFTSVAGGFFTIVVLRLLLGAGESVYFPASSKLVAEEVELRYRALANGLIGFGLALGPAVGTYLGGHLMDLMGWRPVFLVFGVVSLLWLLPWRRQPARSVVAAVKAEDETPSPDFPQILRQRSLWGASLGHLSTNYTFYFILSWLPYYLVKGRGYSMGDMATIATVAYVLNAAGSLVSGWATDRWVSRGVSATLIYKVIMATYHGGAIVTILGIALAGPTVAIGCLFVYQLLCGFSAPGVYAIGQTLAGPRAAGRWIGVQNMVGNLAGIAAPAITGILVEATGSFIAAFALAAAMSVLGLLGWLVMIGRIEPLKWVGERASRAPGDEGAPPYPA